MRNIRERKARGLFADMKFTMAQPEVSCHPETLLPGARTVLSAALCYYAPASEPRAGEGRLPRYTWHDAYAILRDQTETRRVDQERDAERRRLEHDISSATTRASVAESGLTAASERCTTLETGLQLAVP